MGRDLQLGAALGGGRVEVGVGARWAAPCAQPKIDSITIAAPTGISHRLKITP